MENPKLFGATQRSWWQEREGFFHKLEPACLCTPPQEGAEPQGTERRCRVQKTLVLHGLHTTRRILKGMSELKDTIRADLKTAMKARQKERTSALRSLLAAIQAEETNGARHELGDADILRVIAREIKKRRESAQVYADNDRPELAAAELADVVFLEAYQPAQLKDKELSALIDGIIAARDGEVTIKQMGQIMKEATAKAAGRVDGKRLSEAVKARLS